MPQTKGPLDQFYMSSLETNIGWMRPISDGKNLIRLDWNQTGWREPNCPDRLYEFTLPLAPAGKSAAGQYWLNVMAKIPYGTVMTYAEFARLADRPNAARAAGKSCASNPIPIIYPCHRVIRTGGTLGNYGGGSNKNTSHADNLSRKAALLKLEAYQVKLIG